MIASGSVNAWNAARLGCMALELGIASIVATAQSSVRRLPTIVAKKKDEALIGGGDEQKKPPPVGGGGLAAEGTKVPLFQFYQST